MKWYIEYRGQMYDQKIVLRAAHELQGLGALPCGRGTFTANQARQHLQRLDYRVVRKPDNLLRAEVLDNEGALRRP